jgi:predicted MFS family arabinose efflux permease
VMAVLSKLAGVTYQGAVQGFASSVGAIASIAGLVLGGLFYNRIGADVFAVSAVTILVVAAIALFRRDRRRK